MMTETGNGLNHPKPPQPKRRYNRCWCYTLFITAAIVLILFLIILILVLTVFKPKDPKTTLISVNVSGVSPRVTLLTLNIQLNITLNLLLRVYNPNRASFRHAPGNTLIYYRGVQVGDADISPGKIPSRGSEDIRARLTVEAEKLASEIGNLIGDIINGEVGIDTSTRIPGRVSILGFIKRHAVALAQCHLAIGFPDLTIRRQECKQQTNI